MCALFGWIDCGMIHSKSKPKGESKNVSKRMIFNPWGSVGNTD